MEYVLSFGGRTATVEVISAIREAIGIHYKEVYTGTDGTKDMYKMTTTLADPKPNADK